jgi:Sulfatase
MLRASTVIAAAAAAVLAGCALSGGNAESVAAKHERHPPVVFISFDEFSSTSLVDRHGRIDARSFPSFAALAHDGDWFPYATASSDETGRAMEALLTGSLPARGRAPTYGANPRNLFTLFARRYRVDASEEVTSLCPRRLCPHVRRQTKHSVLHELGTGRPERFASWVRSIRARRRPTLYFKHALFPHGPWRYLPSGRHYIPGHEPIPDWGHAFFTSWVATQKYQRHLLQLGFADRLLGSVLKRLRDQGLYDRALIVVTADNGESFGRIGNGHEVSARNFGDIALTPLLIKRPFQSGGRVIRRRVRTVDELPTVARFAHVSLQGRTQGRSVYGGHIPASTTIFQRSGRRFRLSYGGLRRWADGARRIKQRLFAAGPYGIGPDRALVGKPLSGMKVSPAGSAKAVVSGRGAFGRVRLSSGFIPAYVAGRLTGSGAPKAVAVAVNGQIAATSPSFRVRRGGPLYFAALVPEDAFHDGRNDVRVLAISRRGLRAL